MDLFINGIKSELGDSEPSITKKSIDIDNPSDRFLDISNRFDMPDVQINRQIFESPNGIGTNNRSFNKLYNVELIDLFKIFEGQGFLDSARKDKLSFQLVDKSKELFKSLEIKLRDIAWDDKDTLLTTAQIDALDSLDIDNCWFWGKSCLHEQALQVNTDQTTGDARTKYSRPSFYVQGLLKRAITNQGYTFTAPTPDLAFSSYHKDFYFTSYQKTIDTTYNVSGSLAISGLDTNDFEHSDLTVTSTTINIGTKKTAFRVRGSVTTTAQLTLIIKATDNSDGTKISESKTILPTDGVIDFITTEFQSDNGNTISLRIEGTGDATFDDVLLYTLIKDDTEDLSTNPFLGYKIKAHDNLPDLTYKDLFRLICLVYNKYQKVDSFNKTFEFDTFSDLNKLNVKDWSEKYVINSDNTTGKYKGLAQKNFLKYNNDLTVNRELGWSSFLTDNESLQAEKDYITLNFGGSVDVEVNGNDIAQVNIYNDTTRIADQEINIRLFEVDSDKLQFEPLKWENLSENYYKNWFNSLNNIRQINCEIFLKKLDFISWQEKDLIYIDEFKSTFIVLELSNFMSNKPTKAKLLRYGR